MAEVAAADGCDAVFTGESADELFGGYARYRILYWLDRMYTDPHLCAYGGIIDHIIRQQRGEIAERMINRNGKLIDIGDAIDRVSKQSMLRTARDADLNHGLPPLLELESAMIEAHGMKAIYPFGADIVHSFAAELTDSDMVNDTETKHILRDAARLLGVHSTITDEVTKKGLFIPQSWRPDGDAMWSRRWFEDLMRKAYDN